MARRLIASAPHVVEVEEFAPEKLGPTQVRVRTEYASGKHGTAQSLFEKVNFKGQIFDLEGRFFKPAPEGPGWGAFSGPMRLGTTGVGVVQEVGKEVTAPAVGDRVVGLMKIASENVVEATSVWALGDADPLESLCLEPAYVSIHAVREGGLRFGDTVAVFGLGAIGLIAVQMARCSGASRIIAVDPLENRRAWAQAHGADSTLDPTVDDVPTQIHEMTDGFGADLVIEASGSYAALESALKSTRIRGRVSAAGFYQGEANHLWLGREFHHNRLEIIVPHGCGWGHEPRDYPRWDEHRAYSVMVQMLQEKRFDLSGLIDPLVSLDEAPEVWKRIENDPGTVIKYGVEF